MFPSRPDGKSWSLIWHISHGFPYVNSLKAFGSNISCRAKISSVMLSLYFFSLLITINALKKSHDKNKKNFLNKQQKLPQRAIFE